LCSVRASTLIQPMLPAATSPYHPALTVCWHLLVTWNRKVKTGELVVRLRFPPARIHPRAFFGQDRADQAELFLFPLVQTHLSMDTPIILRVTQYLHQVGTRLYPIILTILPWALPAASDR